MSAIIKLHGAQDTGAIRPHRQAPAEVIGEPRVTEADTLRGQLAELERELARLRTSAAGFEIGLADACEVARQEGRLSGLTEAARLERDRLNALHEGIKAACSEWKQSLADAETLGALVAQTCLDKIFGSSKSRIDLVCDLIRAQMERLAQGSVLTCTVSPLDFPDEQLLVALASDAALAGVSVRSDPGLAEGEVVFGLAVGQIDAGLGRQWVSLRQVIEQMAPSGDAL